MLLFESYYKLPPKTKRTRVREDLKEVPNTKQNNNIRAGVMIIIAVIVLSAITPFVTFAQSQQSTINTSNIQTHGQYYGKDDPVLVQINDLKEKGTTESAIANELAKQGMFWNNATGDHGIGKLLTPEEIAKLPPHINPEIMNSSSINGFSISANGVSPLTSYTGTQANVFWKSNNAVYDEDLFNIKPGSLVISLTGTTNHDITSHMGYSNGGSNWDWIEAGIRRDVQGSSLGPFTIYTYWGKGGSEAWYCPSGFSVGPDTSVSFAMELSGPYNSQYNGYPYDFYVNNQWIRRIYMNSISNTVDWANEIWRQSSSNNYDRDSSNAQVYEGIMQSNSGYWYAWGPGFQDNYNVAPYPCPMSSSRTQYTDSSGTFWNWVSAATP